MQMIHNQTADQVAQGNDQLRRTSGLDHGIDDLIVIILLIRLIWPAGQKLLDHIGKILRQRFAHLGARIL